MNTKIKNFMFALLCILCIQFTFAVLNPAYAGFLEQIQGMRGGSSVSLVPTSGGMFDDSILVDMHKFMVKTYKALCKILMVGHALMCYAVNVDYSCIVFCAIAKLPNFNFLLVGLAIYLVGVFISMSVGMYFVDISFKIGFAIIFMPVSMALWPFPPTKNKFADNLSIIIRNAMLFMLVGIGVSYCVKLITEGMFEGGEDQFWDAIANAKNEELTDSFSFFSSHLLVVLFSLIYAFKILEGSVNNYLNAFFSDAAFGSESPMHHMGTQAVGLAYENAVKPAMSLAKDVAKHQTGMAIASVGSGLEKMSTAEGRQEIKQSISNGYNRVKANVNTAAQKTAHAIANPHQTYNQAMAAAGKGANKAIQAVGKGVKETIDIATLVVPVRESTRQKWLNGEIDGQKQKKGLNDYIDKLTQKAGNVTENTIAHGGGKVKEGAKKATAVTGAVAYNAAHAVVGSDKRTDSDAVRAKLHQANQTVDNAVQTATAAVAQPIKAAGQGIAQAGRTTAQFAQGVKQNVQQGAQQIKQNVKQKVLSTETGKILADAYNTRDQAPVTLAPSKILAAPFKAVRHPVDTMEKVANNAEALKGADKKLILKKTGQIVFRSLKDTKQDAKSIGKVAQKTAEGSASLLGGILKDFGHSMADNSARAPGKRGKFDIKEWINAGDDESDEQKKKAYDAEYFRQMGDD